MQKYYSFSKQVFIYNIFGFFLTISFLWLNEFFDLPHRLFGGIITPINITESIIETIFVLLISGVVVFYIKKVLKKWALEVARRKKAEKELLKYSDNLEVLVKEKTKRLEKEHYHLVKAQEIAHVGTWELDVITNIFEWTLETYRIFGITAGKRVTYKSFLNCVHPDDRDFVKRSWIAALKNGVPYDIEHRIIIGSPYDFENRLTLKNSIKWVRGKAELIDDDKKIIKVMGTLSDITDQKEAEVKRHSLEVQLLQSQKMEAIGSLARNMAHEFNNIIGTIMGLTEIVINGQHVNAEDKGYLKEVYSQSENASELVNSIAIFARNKKQVFLPIILSDLLKRITKMIEVILPETIEVRQHIKSPCHHILGDETQIQQVIINIFNNARYSMQGNNGILEINFEEVEFCIEQSNPFGITMPGTYLKLSIKDTGCGMSDEVIEHIFDPFFTTKDVGKGSGLGLSVVYNIIKAHKGAVTVESKLGKGTTFHLYFPIIKTLAVRKPPYLIPVKGNEHILIVENEIALRKSFEVSLKKLGYSITIADNGYEALKIFSSQLDKYNLVFTDQVMPVMTGIELSNELKKINPNIPIILTTGYNDILVDKDTNKYNINKILTKPVKITILTQAIHELLNNKKEV